MKSLIEEIFRILENEPYNFEIIDTRNYIKEDVIKIKKVINHTYFNVFNNKLSNIYAKRIVHILYSYYSTQYLDTTINTLKNKRRPDKDILYDIEIINSFLNLLEKNNIYINSIERNYHNNKDGKFVYDYCKNLIDDLEKKEFKKSLLYKRSQIRTTKKDVISVFNTIVLEKKLEIKKHLKNIKLCLSPINFQNKNFSNFTFKDSKYYLPFKNYEIENFINLL